MAEGGLLPWKKGKNPIDDHVKYVDYDELSRPLPEPPKGYKWVKENDGFLLFDINTGVLMTHLPAANESQNEIKETSPSFAVDEKIAESVPSYIEHVVMPEDTLQGICLRYKIKAHVLKRHNNFSGDSFRMVSVLKIPMAEIRDSVIVPQARTQDVVLQVFRNTTGLGVVEAKLYLDDNDWDPARAHEAWEADNIWEQRQLKDAALPTPMAFPASIPLAYARDCDSETFAPIATAVPIRHERADKLRV